MIYSFKYETIENHARAVLTLNIFAIGWVCTDLLVDLKRPSGFPNNFNGNNFYVISIDHWAPSQFYIHSILSTASVMGLLHTHYLVSPAQCTAALCTGVELKLSIFLVYVNATTTRRPSLLQENRTGVQSYHSWAEAGDSTQYLYLESKLLAALWIWIFCLVWGQNWMFIL